MQRDGIKIMNKTLYLEELGDGNRSIYDVEWDQDQVEIKYSEEDKEWLCAGKTAAKIVDRQLDEICLELTPNKYIQLGHDEAVYAYLALKAHLEKDQFVTKVREMEFKD